MHRASRGKTYFSKVGNGHKLEGVRSTGETVIGIEGGGTKTIALMASAEGAEARLELGPGNVRLLTDVGLRELFGRIAAVCQRPAAIGIGMAGAREEADERRIRSAVEAVWGNVRLAITHDLAIALAAARTDSKTKILVLSGTGSCCFGQSENRETKVGGWGHLLGDRGSGYDIAHSGLREVVREFDRKEKWGALGETVLRALMLNEPNDLIGWMQSAPKSEIAALASAVFDTARDPISRKVIAAAAETLAADGIICASRLASKRDTVTFVLAGSVILKQPVFGKR
ncbi:MAG: N-acetylglucosamine kinase, partial [Limisphaerales bacterium]